MNIVYSTDEKYSQHAYISMYSLLESNKIVTKITIFLIANNLTSATIGHFEKLIDCFNNSSHKRFLVIIDFARYLKSIEYAEDNGSLSTYGRLFLPQMIDVEKAIYIDCDTIVLQNLLDFYNINIENYAVAGVMDIVSKNIKIMTGISPDDLYINAGVCLLNLSYWRKVNGTQSCLNYLKSYDGNIPFHDQGCINGVFNKKILIINPKFNLMNVMLDLNSDQIKEFYDLDYYYSDEEIKEGKENPCVIHFTAGDYIRPWYKNSNHPYASIYKKYYKLSPWSSIEMDKFTKKVKTRDIIKKYILKLSLPIYKFLKKHSRSN